MRACREGRGVVETEAPRTEVPAASLPGGQHSSISLLSPPSARIDDILLRSVEVANTPARIRAHVQLQR